MNDNGEILIYETWKSREKLNNTISISSSSWDIELNAARNPIPNLGKLKKYET